MGVSTLLYSYMTGNLYPPLVYILGDETMRPFQVKLLRVLGYGGTTKELEHLKFFIGESECREVVLVEAVVDDSMYCKPKGYYC
ncbi:unnamed protein product [Arabidopsis lyrata]|uniref:FBD domain-containing protein n=1 Tax=Arabidopsis lyrata subsp. lyrata TaxID=81972 RepID=D7LWC4_ARALL|nr:hypothetical protein ARALYDRAFT_907450 [Arabidopsis lyrata subsp. lyrata]EFH54526.1 hypothetical protein ARALYDRAFT_907438 [Arabidopsis lyrata subsp. lyrata]CAH8269150.1 unnamed protein product [Arabidopsis lyrata]CAH8269160.1 unnamed protein product [Arabidopsis lyrata]